jgi:hypothetical protein
MLLPTSSSVTTAQPIPHTNPSMEPNDSLEMQHPFLEEVRDLEASMGNTETRTPRGGRSQPRIPDGINMRWLLRHDPQYTKRMSNLDYDKKINDKALMANCWKHQHIRKLVEACPSNDAGVVKVRDWFKLLVESRTPSDQSRDTTYVEQIFWAGKNLHAANEEHFESLLVASGAADTSMATLFARDADLATAVSSLFSQNCYDWQFPPPGHHVGRLVLTCGRFTEHETRSNTDFASPLTERIECYGSH